MADDRPVPVWGIEAGDGLIRAVHTVRDADGTFLLLAHEEEESDLPGPEALTRFIKKKGLRSRPMVVAIRSPAAQIATVVLSPEDARHGGEDLRDTLLEYVHPEPEDIDLRFHRESTVSWRLCVDDRASVERYLIALETLGVRSYALVSSLEAIHLAVRSTGLFEGDGVLVGVEPHWTDVFFFEGGALRRHGLPLGAKDLSADGNAEKLAGDLMKLLEYERSKTDVPGPERIVLVGVEGELAESVARHLPSPPDPFPADAGPIRGKGRLSGTRGPALLRTVPAAVGAAIAGAARPYRLDLSFRTLPEEISVPSAHHRVWAAAAILLWLAFAAAAFGLSREIGELEHALAAAEAEPAAPAPSPGMTADLDALNTRARRALGLRKAVETLFAVLPGEASAPYRTDRLSLTADGNSWRVRAEIELPDLDGGADSPRVEALRKKAAEAGLPVRAVLRPDEPVVDVEFAVEDAK